MIIYVRSILAIIFSIIAQNVINDCERQGYSSKHGCNIYGACKLQAIP